MNNKPKLRFKEFSGDWEEKKLSNYTEKITKKNKEFLVTNVISNSAKNGLVSQRDFFDKDIANQNNIDGYYIIENGDFVYNPRKSIESPYGPVNRYNLKDAGVVSPLYLCFKINEKINGKFLEYYFKSSKWYRFIYQNSDQGARHDRVSIKDSEFFKLDSKFPSKEEQDKIAYFFSLIDDKISLQSEKVEALKDYKKGMMQKIFSRELRFKDDDGRDYPEWEEKKIGDICKITTGKLDANAMVKDGQYRFYTCAKEYYRINEYAFDTEALLISGNGANVGYIHYYNGKFNAYQRTYVLDKFSENIEYIKYYLDKYLNQRILEGKNEGNTPYIVLGTLKDMVVMVPNKEEQIKISKLIKPIELKLEKEQEKLNSLNQYKKGLLQQMFV